MTTNQNIDQTLSQRMESLEARIAELQNASVNARRWKTLAVTAGVALIALAGVAATQSSQTADVIRARRFEVVDQNDKIVLLAGIGQNGGQIDVWSNGGTNVLRFGANNDGGDLAIWNNAGSGVASVYASSQGGRIETLMPDGSGSAVSTTLSNTTSGVSSANANVSKVTVTTIGTGYSRANAYIYGSGTGATARVIVSPKYGHAYNPANELNASNLMFAVRVGEIDTTENGLISSNTSFRQYGLLANPHKYANTTAVTQTTANSVISQTTGLGLVAGASYTLDEFVYQGASSSTATFYGYINSQTSNEVELSKVIGTVTIGLPLVGLSSGVSRIIITKTNPEFKPYTGDILYVENITKTQREDGQAENVKIVVRF